MRPRIATPPSAAGDVGVARVRRSMSNRSAPRPSPAMADLTGRMIVGVVAQEPFDHGADSFAHIIPCWFSDGSSARDALPGNGHVWWRIGGRGRDFAKPGKLIEATLEPAQSAGEPGKSHYQAAGDSAVPVRAVTGWEVLDAGAGSTAESLFEPAAEQVIAWQPGRDVLFRCGDSLVGPVRVATKQRGRCWVVRPLLPNDGLADVTPIDDGLEVLNGQCIVSSTGSSPDVAAKHGDTFAVTPNFVVAGQFAAARKKQTARRVLVETDRQLIERVKRLIPDADEWEAFAQFFPRVVAAAEAEDLPSHTLPRLERLRSVADRYAEAVGEWVQKLRLSEEIEEFVREEVARRADGLVEDVEAQAKKKVERAWADADREIQEAEQFAEQGVQETKRSLPAALKELEDARSERDRALAEITAAEKDAERVRAEADAHTAAVAERLEHGRAELIREAAALAPLLGGSRPAETSAEIARPLSTFHVRPPRTVGPPLAEPEAVVEPLKAHLTTWTGGRVKARQARSLLAAVLSHPIVLVPEAAWGRGLASALGAAFTPVCVEADWLSFQSFADSEAAAVWRHAVEHPDELHILHLDGPDRSPSTAWVCPLAALVAGLRHFLPLPGLSPDANGWPPNLRLLTDRAGGPESFDFPNRLRQVAVACGDVRGEESVAAADPVTPPDGYFPVEVWRRWSDSEAVVSGPPAQARQNHLARLLAILDPERDADACRSEAADMRGEWLLRLSGAGATERM